MDTLTNAIIVKVQKTLHAETNLTDAETIRAITRKIASMSAGEKKLVLMTMTAQQICSKYGN